MRIGVVVDSACDLPPDFIRENNIQILPITIHLGQQDLVDTRDPEATLNFYRQHQTSASDAGTSPFTVEQIKKVFLTRLVLDYDFVFCLTIASSRSPIYENAVKASFAILSEYKAPRAQAGVSGPFALRVIDTQNLFAGQGLLAIEAVRMIKTNPNPNKIRERLESLVQNTYGYMIPRNLHYIRARAQKKGDRSVGWVSAVLGTALDIKPLLRAYRNETGPVAKLRHFDDSAERCFAYIGRRITQNQLLTPTLSLCYGGELTEMEKLPGYDELMKICREHGIEVFQSIMSITGGVNVGEGSLAFAFAAQPHELDV
ncbi:DegV family protein [Stenotrophobium rhamnosiphilum]|uniref:Fatty acid-binding protein DegV n=1 Tax=Stenotrophobium rhamnosiphilum TaxID=2029166 RepID=A0A2T5MHK2_9GAMM|nr:DegV family protein [Stenotrophobium rhamnosiphilum]PTU32066.1 fatty acid-binding protein DegV [Stenotrophobium rhamnosiphilum]